jgi:hypothetical protein
MKFDNITDCLHSFIDGYSNNEALIDATNAHRQSKQALEKLLDEQLWIPEDYVFDNEQDEAYYKALAQIEERLVAHELIYND